MSLARFCTGASFGFHVLSSEHEQRSKSPCFASKPHFPPPKSIRILALITSNGLHGNSFLLSTFSFRVAGDDWPKGVQYIKQILAEKNLPLQIREGTLQCRLDLGLEKREK